MKRTRRNRRKAVRRRPRLPKFKVNWKALLMPPAIAGLVFGLALSGKTLLDRPVGQLVIEGPFQRVTAIQVEAALAPELDAGFLSIDLKRLQRQVQLLDWIDDAKIGRSWPNRILVRVTEHQAAARWGERGLLNVRGELFTENARHAFPELPRLAGPPGSEREVATLYLAVRGRLADAHLVLESLQMDARGALRFVLAGGQEIRLGRRDVQQRLDRFFEVAAPVLATEFHDVDYVDLRYTNGFAVGWLEQPETEVADTRERSGRG